MKKTVTAGNSQLIANLDRFCQDRAAVLSLLGPGEVIFSEETTARFLEFLRAYGLPGTTDSLLPRFHRMRYACTDLDEQLRLDSQAWLAERELPFHEG